VYAAGVIHAPRAAAVCLALLFTACSKPAPPKITTVKPKAVTIDQTGLKLAFDLGMQNPNGVDIPVEHATAHVVLDNTIDLGTVTIPEAVTLPAKGEATVPVLVPLQWGDFGQLARLASEQRDLSYKSTGTVTLGGALLNVTVPFEADGTIKRDELTRGVLQGLPKLPHFNQ